jgi:hypothetical protein
VGSFVSRIGALCSYLNQVQIIRLLKKKLPNTKKPNGIKSPVFVNPRVRLYAMVHV